MVSQSEELLIEMGLLKSDGLVWVFQTLPIIWDFPAQPSVGFRENVYLKKKKTIQKKLGTSILLMSEEINQTASIQ